MKPKKWIEFDSPDVSFRSHFISAEDASLIRDFYAVILHSTAIWWFVWLITMNETVYLLLVLMAFLMLFLNGYCEGLDTLPIEVKVDESD